MAHIYEPTKSQLARYKRWCKALSPAALAVSEKFNPWTLYLLKSSGHRVFIVNYADDGTLVVAVTGRFNKVAFERDVFGIPPDDLEECDLPEETEDLGSVLTQEQMMDNIDVIRATSRPDLFVLDENGKAVRRQ